MQTTTNLRELEIYQIAAIIRSDWQRPYFGAVPYIEAMAAMSSIDDAYGYDDGRGIVAYFLSNASTWRGETARNVKAELKRRLGR